MTRRRIGLLEINQEGPEMDNSVIGVGFPCPRPPPPASIHKGSHQSGILLNRRTLLSRNQPKSQPLPKQPLKPRNSSATKMSAPRPSGNPKIINNYRPETSQKGKPPKSTSLGSDTSEEQNENGNSLSWQGLAPVSINAPGTFTAPVNPIMSQQEPLPKFLHRTSIPPPGPNPGTGTNFNNNAWYSDRPASSDLTTGNFKLAEMSDLPLSAPDSGHGSKVMAESQDGTIPQQHLSPSSSTSSLSLAYNKSGSANMFHMSSQPTGPSLGAKKSDMRRLPSALIPLTNAPSLPQGQSVVRKKKKKRKKQENQELLFENTVVEGKSLQNSALPNQLGNKPLALTGSPVHMAESKLDHPHQGMVPTPIQPPMLNNQKKPDKMTKNPPFVNGHSYPAAILPSKERGRTGGLWMAPSVQHDTRIQKEVDAGQPATQNEDGLNDLTTVGNGLFGKKPVLLDSKSISNIPSASVNNPEEANKDLISGKPLPVPFTKDKWSLPENGLQASSKKQAKPTSPFHLVEPEVVKTKPPLPYARKSLPR